MLKEKLLYVLPEYDLLTPSHTFHILELLPLLGERMDIFLLIERGKGSPQLANIKHIYVQRITPFPFCLLERFLVILAARVKGYRKVYVHYSYMGALLAVIVNRLAGGKVFYWHCEYFEHFTTKFRWTYESLMKKLTDEWLMILVMRTVDYVVTCSRATVDFYHSILGVTRDRMFIIPNWVRLERFRVTENKQKLRRRLGIASDGKVVLFLHHLAPRKGADFLPEIARLVAQRVPGVEFIVAGDGPLRKELTETVRKEGLSKVMKIVGPVPNVNVPSYFGATDLFIMPSRQEGFARVLLEAMAMGVPFVLSGSGGAGEILTASQRRYLLPAGDLLTFADRVVYLLNNKPEREMLIKEGKKQVEKFSLEGVAEKFYRMLTK